MSQRATRSRDSTTGDPAIRPLGTGGWPALQPRLPSSIHLFLILALPLVGLFLSSQRAWYTSAPEQPVEFGVNFSCRQAEYLGFDCATLFAEVLDDLRARHIRLSMYWEEIEHEPGIYDFRTIDLLLNMAHARGARVLVTIGMKAQRHPEYWIPEWVAAHLQTPEKGFPEDTPALRGPLLRYLSAGAGHIGTDPAVEAIQVENEPFTSPRSTSTGWSMRPAFLLEEIAAVRAADPGSHPIVVNHGGWTRWDSRWRWILEHADVLGQSVYTKRQRGPWPWLYLQPYRWGWVTPDLPAQARVAAARGRGFWITELQAEPFEQPGIDLRRIPTAEAGSYSAARMKHNLTLARRSGADRAYLWGVEWWAYLRHQRGEPELWEIGRAAIAGGDADGSLPQRRSARRSERGARLRPIRSPAAAGP